MIINEAITLMSLPNSKPLYCIQGTSKNSKDKACSLNNTGETQCIVSLL